MGVPVKGIDDFRRKLRRVRRESVIFGFLLYDSRPTQESVASFANTQGEWIDELARRTGIYFFFPIKSTDGQDWRNPSPEVMRAFKLGTARLPGVVLFAPPRPDGSFRTKHAVYVPLAEQDFDTPEAYQPVLDDLFALIYDCLSDAEGSHETLALIQSRIKKLRRSRNRRGLVQWLRKGARVSLFEVPAKLYGPFAEGFGKALGDRVVGG